METFRSMAIGGVFKFERTGIADFVTGDGLYIKLKRDVYGSLTRNAAVIPLLLHGREVYHVYKTADLDRRVLPVTN